MQAKADCLTENVKEARDLRVSKAARDAAFQAALERISSKMVGVVAQASIGDAIDRINAQTADADLRTRLAIWCVAEKLMGAGPGATNPNILDVLAPGRTIDLFDGAAEPLPLMEALGLLGEAVKSSGLLVRAAAAVCIFAAMDRPHAGKSTNLASTFKKLCGRNVPQAIRPLGY